MKAVQISDSTLRIQAAWRNWQDENEAEAAKQQTKFANAAIFGDFEKAESQHTAFIARKIGRTFGEVARARNELANAGR